MSEELFSAIIGKTNVRPIGQLKDLQHTLLVYNYNSNKYCRERFVKVTLKLL